ncbi:MAG: DnaD domain protein [Anaerovoracaceae bacterium]|nr:DnaD domain protein [Anaerovoracaceae bacterium]
MSFEREEIRDIYLLTTEVENIFINEYMPGAPGDFVKVYLYGLLYSGSGSSVTGRQMSHQLGLSMETIEAAWDYWEEAGVITRTHAAGEESPAIRFRQLRALMYGKGAEQEQKPPFYERDGEKTGPLSGEDLKYLLASIEDVLGKPLSSGEIREVFSWSEELGATDEVILGAVSYCAEKGKTSIRYIAKVVAQWHKEGLRTGEDVKEHLEGISRRLSAQKEILRSLGLNRNATPGERTMIDRWFDEMHFNMERVMDACAKAAFIASPNVKYVNKILENWYEEAKAGGRDVNTKVTVTGATLKQYYEYLRKKAEEEAENRKAEVYDRLPRIKEIDEELLNMGRRLSKAVLSQNPEEIKEIRRMTELLTEERSVLLAENNYREDYTDIKYACDKCRDTGITADGVRCSCAEKRIGEAEIWQNSNSSKS